LSGFFPGIIQTAKASIIYEMVCLEGGDPPLATGEALGFLVVGFIHEWL